MMKVCVRASERAAQDKVVLLARQREVAPRPLTVKKALSEQEIHDLAAPTRVGGRYGQVSTKHINGDVADAAGNHFR